MKDGEVVRTASSGVAAIFKGLLDERWGEVVGIVVEWVISPYLFQSASYLRAGAVGNKSGELVAELCGDGLRFGEDSVVEVDGLVGVLVGARP